MAPKVTLPKAKGARPKAKGARLRRNTPKESPPGAGILASSIGYLTPGSRESAPGTSTLAAGSRYTTSGSGTLAPGSRESAAGTGTLAAGSRYFALGTRYSTPGTRYSASGTGYSTSGARYSTSDPRTRAYLGRLRRPPRRRPSGVLVPGPPASRRHRRLSNPERPGEASLPPGCGRVGAGGG